MRKRLVFALAVLMMTLVAFPLGASAAAPNTAQVSATTWRDMMGREMNSLCQSGQAGAQSIGPAVEMTVKYSGKGSDMAGNGTGSLTLYFYGNSFEISGTIVVNGEEKMLQGGGQMFCILPDAAIVYGEFVYSDYFEVTGQAPVEGVYGSITGSISDGVHASQGSLSLSLRETGAIPI